MNYYCDHFDENIPEEQVYAYKDRWFHSFCENECEAIIEEVTK